MSLYIFVAHFFLLLSNISMDIPHFVYLPIDNLWGCFQFLIIVSKAATTMYNLCLKLRFHFFEQILEDVTCWFTW